MNDERDVIHLLKEYEQAHSERSLLKEKLEEQTRWLEKLRSEITEQFGEPIPVWQVRKFLTLYDRFGYEEFSFNDMEETLDMKSVGTLLHPLTERGWISKRRSGEDKRVAMYRIELGRMGED